MKQVRTSEGPLPIETTEGPLEGAGDDAEEDHQEGEKVGLKLTQAQRSLLLEALLLIPKEVEQAIPLHAA